MKLLLPRRRLVPSLLLVAACQPAMRLSALPPGNAEQDILRAEREWTNAMMRMDTDVFATYLDDRWVLLNAGLVLEKQLFLDSMRVARKQNATIELSNVKVRFPRPDVAVVTANYATRVKAGTTERMNVGTYLDTWAWIGGRWQLVASAFATILKSP